MYCKHCGEKMVKLKYLYYEELETYLSSEYKPNLIENYEEWLRSLKAGDLVLTSFKREEYGNAKVKYYLRVVEETTKKGIKLGKLTKVFKYEVGEIVYRQKEGDYPITTYKILPINEQVDRVIRDYCKDRDAFDIERLNKMITGIIA